MQIRSIVVLVLMLAMLLLARPAHAARSYDNCTGFISAVPATISAPGTWCLKQNVSMSVTSAPAILVAANHVVLDCNDFMVDGLGLGTANTITGILNSGLVTDVTVRHCTVRGFNRGTSLIGQRITIEDSVYDLNTSTGILIDGGHGGTVVRRNRILNTGGSTIPGAPAAEGIYVANSDSVPGPVAILDNTISGSTTVGIDSKATATTISGNDVSVGASGIGIRPGTGGGTAIVRDNVLSGDVGTGSVGVDCSASTATRFKDNVIHGFATGTQSCVDAGGNDVSP